ncbi:MAG: permease prefix domain 1-containing protein [Pirellulales bacterium]|nr:permease prefix domain 1-containing protein [Pirellulales bacterium]
MSTTDPSWSLEAQIDQWRNYLRRRQAIDAVDVAELEDNLREQIGALRGAGLAADEAFLVAVKRMGALDELSCEFAREHAERLWKQLVVSSSADPTWSTVQTEGLVAVALGVVAAGLTKLPELFGLSLADHEEFYLRNLSFFTLPLLTVYFVWRRRLTAGRALQLAAVFVVAGLFANVYPFVKGGHTQALLALHLPIALWLVVGMAYAGVRWRDVAGRMDFIRFSGELYIYYVLIALGGGVFMAFLAMLFKAIGIDPDPIAEWIMPCGAAGAVFVASWLVEAKQSVIENMAPVLTRLFTPLFAILLISFLAIVLWTGRAIDISRDVLIAFDLLLAVVLGLLLYAVSARDPRSPPGAFDFVQVVLVLSALMADAVALWAIAARISEFGFSPNRVAALGENLILLVNLAWAVALYIRFLRGQTSFESLEQWLTSYLPVYFVWAAIVVIVFPPLFGFR